MSGHAGTAPEAWLLGSWASKPTGIRLFVRWPAGVLDLVCDLHRDRQAVTKIRKVLDVDRDGDGGDVIVRFRSRLRGMPTLLYVNESGAPVTSASPLPTFRHGRIAS